MAKNPLRAALDKALAELGLYVPNAYDNGVIVEGNKDSRRVKYVAHRVLSTNIMYELLLKVGANETVRSWNHRYVYVTLTSPKAGAWHGMVVGTTNNENVIKRAVCSGPIVYSDNGQLCVRVTQSDELDPLNDELFDWYAVSGYKREETLELYTASAHEKQLEEKMQDVVQQQEAARQRKAMQLLETREKQQDEYLRKYDAYDAACAAGFKTRILGDMHDELLQLADAWEVIGMPLKRKK